MKFGVCVGPLSVVAGLHSDLQATCWRCWTSGLEYQATCEARRSGLDMNGGEQAPNMKMASEKSQL